MNSGWFVGISQHVLKIRKVGANAVDHCVVFPNWDMFKCWYFMRGPNGTPRTGEVYISKVRMDTGTRMVYDNTK